MNREPTAEEREQQYANHAHRFKGDPNICIGRGYHITRLPLPCPCGVTPPALAAIDPKRMAALRAYQPKKKASAP